MSFGANLDDVEKYDIDEIYNFIINRSKAEERLFKNLRELLRWHAYMIIKAQSKEGIKIDDWKFADEKLLKKPNPLKDKKSIAWRKKMDAMVAAEFNKNRNQ